MFQTLYGKYTHLKANFLRIYFPFYFSGSFEEILQTEKVHQKNEANLLNVTSIKVFFIAECCLWNGMSS